MTKVPSRDSWCQPFIQGTRPIPYSALVKITPSPTSAVSTIFNNGNETQQADGAHERGFNWPRPNGVTIGHSVLHEKLWSARKRRQRTIPDETALVDTASHAEGADADGSFMDCGGELAGSDEEHDFSILEHVGCWNSCRGRVSRCNRRSSTRICSRVGRGSSCRSCVRVKERFSDRFSHGYRHRCRSKDGFADTSSAGLGGDEGSECD